jgi:drug/metabolite transporter (DMT)-like permease
MTHAATLWFGAFRSRPTWGRTLSPRAWTCVGAFAIPLWATWPALALWSLEMPAFECLTIAFAVGWITLTLLDRPSVAGRAASESAPGRALAAGGPESGSGNAPAARRWLSWLPAIACAVGLSGSNAFHILATHYIPAAEANLISYLWPVEIVAAGAVLGLFRLRARQIIGLGLGFVGAVILMAGDNLSLSATGVGLALLSGLSWAGYCVFRLKWTFQSARNVLGTGCAISTVLCAVLHFALEPTVAPSVGTLGAAAAVGVMPLALGNYVWDEGFRRGDSQLLTVLAYATPLCSALLLGALGLALLTWGLLVGAVVIVTAGVLSRADR